MIFGLRLHWGDPNLPTQIRAYSGSLLNKERERSTDSLVLHPVVQWWGVSHQSNWWFGFMRFSKRIDTSTPSQPQNWGEDK